jgi:hypothetical protein
MTAATSTIKVKPSQLITLLAAFIKAKVNVLITGAPGIGKSDIIAQAAALAGADLILSHPAVEDPTVVAGLPWLNGAKKDEATFLPFGNLALAIKAKKLTVWDLEDLGQSTPAMQAAYMQLLLAKEVNGHKLSPHVTFVASTNRRTDRSGVSGILEAVKSRFGTIVELEVDVNDWTQWAFANNIPTLMVAFIRYRPELLSKFVPTADLTNSPSPRTWSHVAKIEAMNLPQEIEMAAMGGAVGEGPAGEYLAFRKMAATLPNLDAIILNPQKAKIPSEASELYATCMGLARKATATNFQSILTYATRLYTEGSAGIPRGEFAVLLIRDVQRFDEDGAIQHTHAFTQMAIGPIGALMDGRDIAA